MQCDGLESAVFGHPSHRDMHQFVIVPARAKLASERNRDGRAHLAQDRLHQRKIAQQAGAAVALHHFVDGAAEIDVDDVKAEFLAIGRGACHDLGIGSEELRGDGMLRRVERQVTLGLGDFAGFGRVDNPVRTGKLGHQKAAAALIPDQPAENCVRDSSHGSESTVAGEMETGPIWSVAGNCCILCCI